MKNSFKISKFDSLHMLFAHNIKVNHISEKLEVCNTHSKARDVYNMLYERNFDVIGVEEDGQILGYVERNDLKDGECSSYIQSFSSKNLISGATSIMSVLKIFKDKTWMFVLEENNEIKIVTRADLQKSPVRLLLFGMISLLEMNLLRIIKKYYCRDSWRSKLSSNRIDYAKDLLKKRIKRNEEIGLIDCLQLCDKKKLIAKNDSIMNVLNMSKNKLRSVIDDIEDLRNNLAHSQDIMNSTTWPDLINVLDNLEEIINTVMRQEINQLPGQAFHQ